MKTRFVALAVAATLGLGTASAFAQGYHRDGEWQHQRAEQGRGDWGHRYDYGGPRYDRGDRHDDGDLAGALVLGALTGALMGQAQDSYSYAPPATYYAPPPATYYTPPPTYYTPAPPVYYGPGYSYYGG